MKSILVATALLLSSIIGFAQCTPNAATGTPGITPSPDNVTCITRGTPYSTTMQLENFSSFNTPAGAVTMVSATIDSLVNFPCGITWQSDKLTYAAGETGCILVSGTTTDAVGQYKLEIYMTITLNIPFLGQQTQSGEISSLIQTLNNFAPGTINVDLDYYSRVIQSGNCPAIDTSGSANNLTASGGATCPSLVLGVSISGNTSVCAGIPTTLTATATNPDGNVAYSWNTGATTQSITVNLSSTTTYSVTVTDNSASATDSHTVTVNSAPNTAFTATENGADVTFSSTTSGATSYAWDFGDSTTSTLQSPPVHTYADNGAYTITLIATNSCGSDTATQDVTITGVFINSVEYDLNFDVFPNPSTGNISLNFSAENASAYDLNIHDLSGKNVYAEKITATAGNVQKQLDLTALPKGIYTLRLTSESGFGVKKLQLN